MFDRLGLEKRDGRNLLVVAGIVALVFFVLTDEPALVRVLTALIGGAISAVAFLVVTIAINAYRPGHW